MTATNAAPILRHREDQLTEEVLTSFDRTLSPRLREFWPTFTLKAFICVRSKCVTRPTRKYGNTPKSMILSSCRKTTTSKREV